MPVRVERAELTLKGGVAARCRPPSRPRCRVSFVLGALSGAYLAVTGCDYSRYPVEASFCDGWCRMLRRTPCEQEPENCVRDCENSRPSARCDERQLTLLACYEGAPAEAFACVGEGFQASIRPRPEICTEERQAFVECEAPRVKACIDACEVLDQSPFDGGTPLGGERCPVAPIPCERLCWELNAQLAAAGANIPADASAEALAQLGEPLIRCAQGRASDCHAEASMSAPGEQPGLSWTRAFFECSGLPVPALAPRP